MRTNLLQIKEKIKLTLMEEGFPFAATDSPDHAFYVVQNITKNSMFYNFRREKPAKNRPCHGTFRRSPGWTYMFASKTLLYNHSPDMLSLDDNRHAVFFDIDGTLIDLASTPERVIIDQTLVEGLERLGQQLSGAVALVTGRPLEFVEKRFPAFSGAVAALHGTEFRLPTGRVEKLQPDAHFRLAKEFLHQGSARREGLLVEDKGNAIALHYRSQPELKERAFTLIHEARKMAGPEWRIQPGKFVFELRFRHGDKGAALRRLMQETPFAGRMPIAFGDDLTDVPMLEAAREQGGMGIAVGEAIGEGRFLRMLSPAHVRNWVLGGGNMQESE